MNECIAKLANQSGFDVDATGKFGNYSEMHRLKKFAELIVRECAGIVAKRKNQAIDGGWNVDEAMTMAEMDLEEHFGVE